MRIIDWSSDVCSSDLEIRQFGAIEIESGFDILFYQVNHRLAAFAAIAMDVLEQVQRKGAGTVEKLAVLRLKVQKFAAFDPGKQRLQPFDRGGGQIGRASCRERVCP